MKINKWFTGFMTSAVLATTALAGKAPSTAANPSNSKEKVTGSVQTSAPTFVGEDTHKNQQGKGHEKAIGKGHHKGDVSGTE